MKNILLFFVFILLSIPNLDAHPAWGMTIDDDGNIYFADIFHNGRGTLWKLTNDRKLIPLLKDFHAHNVNLDKDGYPISAHGEDNHTIVQVLPDGKLDTIYHTLDLKEFFGGNTAYSKQGNIYFQIDKYIWKIDKNGVKTKYNDHKLEWNQVIYVDDDENLYVTDIGVGNGTIFKFDTNGKVTKIAEDLIAKLDRPKDKHNDVLLGMTKDDKGNLYVCELAGKQIYKIDTTGKQSIFYNKMTGWTPNAICFKDEIAYILETDGMNFQIFEFRQKVDREYGTVLVDYESYTSKKQSLEQKNEMNKQLLIVAMIIGILMIFISRKYR